MLKTTLRLALPLLMTLAIAAPASATKPKKDPRADVLASYEKIKAKSATATSKAALNAEITKILDGMVNWDAFSEKTMGKTIWGEFKDEQKAAFIAAYKKLITKKYAGRFKPKPTKTFDVEFRGKTEFKKTSALVKTTVFTYDDGKKVGVDVDYHFALVKGAFGVSDIVTDTVSRARSYRKKFQALYNKKGFDALVARIEKNAAKKKK